LFRKYLTLSARIARPLSQMRFPFSNDLSTHAHLHTHTHTRTFTHTHTHSHIQKHTHTVICKHPEEEKSSRVISLCQVKFLQRFEAQAYLRVHPNLRPDKHFISVSSVIFMVLRDQKKVLILQKFYFVLQRKIIFKMNKKCMEGELDFLQAFNFKKYNTIGYRGRMWFLFKEKYSPKCQI
jgi:hypothetical protein